MRKEEHIQELESLGSKNNLNLNDPDFDQKLTELAKKLRAKVCFEAIAGPTSGRVMNCMPFGSHMLCYGILSE